MEFKSLKNIESSFRHLRLFGIVYLCVCTLLVGFSVWKAYSFAEAQREKIYVLDEGKSLMLALSQDLEQNRPVEAREHVRRFHELFFTLSPDKNAIEGNIRRAMFLSDRSAYAHYVDLAEQGLSLIHILFFFTLRSSLKQVSLHNIACIRISAEMLAFAKRTFRYLRILASSTNFSEKSLPPNQLESQPRMMPRRFAIGLTFCPI